MIISVEGEFDFILCDDSKPGSITVFDERDFDGRIRYFDCFLILEIQVELPVDTVGCREAGFGDAEAFRIVSTELGRKQVGKLLLGRFADLGIWTVISHLWLVSRSRLARFWLRFWGLLG